MSYAKIYAFISLKIDDNYILEQVEKTFGYTEKEVLGKNRSPDLVEVRWITYYLMAHLLKWPAQKVAVRCKKHHTSVLYGIAAVSDPVRNRIDPSIKTKLELIKKRLPL